MKKLSGRIKNLGKFAHPPKGLPSGGKIGKMATTVKKSRGSKVRKMKTPKEID